ncbi:MAG: DRTGG domain-containing protein [Anaerolineae bacterium]
MTLREIARVLGAEVLTEGAGLDREIKCAFGADLMSDVLSLSRDGALLLTGLTHPQVVRTADMAGNAAILFVRDKQPEPDTVALAEELGIPLLRVKETMFTTAGRLYTAGLNGIELHR